MILRRHYMHVKSCRVVEDGLQQVDGLFSPSWKVDINENLKSCTSRYILYRTIVTQWRHEIAKIKFNLIQHTPLVRLQNHDLWFDHSNQVTPTSRKKDINGRSVDIKIYQWIYKICSKPSFYFSLLLSILLVDYNYFLF